MTTLVTSPIGTARRSALRRGSSLVGTAVATVELLRADAAGVARASGWWGPSGLLLHRTRPGRTAPYVSTTADALAPAVLRALRAGGLDPAPARVAIGAVHDVLAVARGAHRDWIIEVGARHPGEVALLRWEVRWSDRRAAAVGAAAVSAVAVSAVVVGPAGAAAVRVTGSGAASLIPTSTLEQSAMLASVNDVLVARCHLEVAEVARTAACQRPDARASLAVGQLTRSATSTPSRIGATELM